eukprot:UN4559
MHAASACEQGDIAGHHREAAPPGPVRKWRRMEALAGPRPFTGVSRCASHVGGSYSCLLAGPLFPAALPI